MTTANDIITQALKKAGVLGVGQTALAEDVNDAFNDLNDMIAQWNRKRWVMWHLVATSFVSTGAQSYTVGPGGNFNIARPDRLEDAYFRQLIASNPNQIDYPLEILEAREDYDKIALKTLSTFPSYIFYDAANPMGSVYPWPVIPASLYSLFIVTKETLLQFATLTTALVAPPEFVAAMKWNLATRLCVSYQQPVSEDLKRLASDSLNVIRNANTQIPRLQVDPTLIRPGLFNIYFDQIR